MAIYCKKCGYQMTEAEIVGYFSPEISTVFEKIVYFVVTYYTKKRSSPTIKRNKITSMLIAKCEEFVIGLLNRKKIPCFFCENYEYWVKKYEQIYPSCIKAQEKQYQ